VTIVAGGECGGTSLGATIVFILCETLFHPTSAE